ncbi:MAG: NAD(P)-dependent alcohol dehydrogenase [Proteobacteria bacterium]|nr:NAD(P)-dependent alcohol dehydrogenase [Pseudomonadota bacterium]
MIKTQGYAATDANKPLGPFQFERREPREKEVLIEITHCGVCHSDIHQARNEWGKSIFPMVPGHEIIGKVTRVGPNVSKFKAGDLVGVGCLVDSCRSCGSCKEGLEQYCEKGLIGTYNSYEKDGKTPTYGGYSNCIVVHEDFTLKIPENLDPAKAAPLLCAGITTYSPLRHFGVKAGQKVGVMGLGGLGHMGVKLAHAMGAHVVVFTTSPAKVEDAKRLGANEVVISKDAAAMAKHNNTFDFILNTISAPIDINPYLELLKREGTMCVVGVAPTPPTVETAKLIFKRRNLAGSLIGGLPETQEMLDFCGKHNITCDIEVIPIQKINEAYERTIKSDVKYRFVIDMKSLKQDF